MLKRISFTRLDSYRIRIQQDREPRFLSRLVVLVLFVTLLSGNLIAAQRAAANDAPTSSRQTAITKAVRESSPAVVGINVTAVQEQQSPFSMNDPMLREFFGNDPFQP